MQSFQRRLQPCFELISVPVFKVYLFHINIQRLRYLDLSLKRDLFFKKNVRSPFGQLSSLTLLKQFCPPLPRLSNSSNSSIFYPSRSEEADYENCSFHQ